MSRLSRFHRLMDNLWCSVPLNTIDFFLLAFSGLVALLLPISGVIEGSGLHVGIYAAAVAATGLSILILGLRLTSTCIGFKEKRKKAEKETFQELDELCQEIIIQEAPSEQPDTKDNTEEIIPVEKKKKPNNDEIRLLVSEREALGKNLKEKIINARTGSCCHGYITFGNVLGFGVQTFQDALFPLSIAAQLGVKWAHGKPEIELGIFGGIHLVGSLAYFTFPRLIKNCLSTEERELANLRAFLKQVLILQKRVPDFNKADKDTIVQLLDSLEFSDWASEPEVVGPDKNKIQFSMKSLEIANNSHLFFSSKTKKLPSQLPEETEEKKINEKTTLISRPPPKQ